MNILVSKLVLLTPLVQFYGSNSSLATCGPEPVIESMGQYGSY